MGRILDYPEQVHFHFPSFQVLKGVMQTSHPGNARTSILSNRISLWMDFHLPEHCGSCLDQDMYVDADRPSCKSSVHLELKSLTTWQVKATQTPIEACTSGWEFPKSMEGYRVQFTHDTLHISYEFLPLPECIWKQAGTLFGEDSGSFHDVHEKGDREQVTKTRPIAAWRNN